MGTTDISVCEMSMVEGELMVEVKTSYGDVFLGGQNYDNAIVQWLVDEFKNEHNGADLTKDLMAYSRLVDAAEKAKCELSSTTSVEINLPYIMPVDGVPQHIERTLTRAKFEQMTADITAKAIDCASKAFEKANKKPSEVDSILLVGGSTRIPAVQDALKKAFNIKLETYINPDEAVAMGAAIQANTLCGGSSTTNILLLDVTSLAFGIETEGGLLTKMVEANTTIPTSETEVFTTAADNQPVVSIKIYTGERTMAKDCKFLGEFNLEGIMPAPRGVPQIEVTFDIDANGILKVSAKDKATGKANNITITSGNSLSKEEIEQIKADAERFKAADEKQKADIETLNSAESYAYMIKKTVDDKDLVDKISDDDKKSANEKADALLESVTAKDVDKVKVLREDLEACYKSISEKIYAQAGQSQQTDAGQTTNESTATDGQSQADNVQDIDFEEVK